MENKYGTWVVDIPTIVFLITLISGFILWWPKLWRGTQLKRNLWKDWKSNWKSLNYDLHNVIVIYSFFIAIKLAITGLVFIFPSFKTSYINFFKNFDNRRIYAIKETHGNIPEYFKDGEQMDIALRYLQNKYPNSGMM